MKNWKILKGIEVFAMLIANFVFGIYFKSPINLLVVDGIVVAIMRSEYKKLGC